MKSLAIRFIFVYICFVSLNNMLFDSLYQQLKIRIRNKIKLY